MPAAETRCDLALPSGQPRTFERQSQVLFLVPKLDLSAMQIVDVEGGTDPIDDDAAGFSRNQREAVVAPFAVGAREPRPERERLLLSEALGEGFAGDRPVVGMNMTKAVLGEGARTTEISG